MTKGLQYLSIVITCFICACGSESTQNETGTAPAKVEVKPLFSLLSADETGVDFTNFIPDDKMYNPHHYINVFNGGGVAIGDINNDGLPDIYFTGNYVANKLFLNKGGLKFEDITEQAGVDGEGGWSTGVTMVDINADGFMDIYVCQALSD
ncbi:MAG: VCBS repeat-containing protein, partial [Bacteroidetes bacterium]|nr:VCBS repeat-containing protein [Bacteroidota bacterium]